MRRRLLAPVLGFALAILVATVGVWCTEADDLGPAHFASPDCPPLGQVAGLGRLPNGRSGTSGTSSLPLVVLPATVGAPAALDRAAGVWSQARPQPNGRIVSAGRTSRGPPLA